MKTNKLLKIVAGGVVLLAAQLIWFLYPVVDHITTPIVILTVMIVEWCLSPSWRVAIRNLLLSAVVLVSWRLYCDNTVNLGAGLYLLALLVRYRSFWGRGPSIYERSGSVNTPAQLAGGPVSSGNHILGQ